MFNEHEIRKILHNTETILCRLATVEEALLIIEQKLSKPQSAKLSFKNSKGEKIMATSVTVHINDVPLIAVLTEFDGPNGTGNKVPPTGAVGFVSDHPEIVTVDAASGQLGYVTEGTATITGTDAGNSLADSGAVTVTVAPAVSAVLSFVAPPAKP